MVPDWDRKGNPGGAWGPELVSQYFNHNAKGNPPFLSALAKCRDIAVREGWCYQHVQAIIVAIDQYAEAATGNRQ